MNGLANAILTLLLSWLRMIVDRIWSLVNSDTGNRFFTFLSEHWVIILLVLAAGGFVVDKIIYLIRWRPFSVRRRRREQQQALEAYYAGAQAEPQPAPMYDPRIYARPEPQPVYHEEPPYQQEQPYYDREAPAGAPMQNTAQEQTAVYTRPASTRNAYRPPLTDVEPIFDEQPQWYESDALVTETPLQPAQPMPVSDQYMKDVYAGFAKPVPPEQIYTPVQPAPQPENAEAAQVHPGLDADLLRRNIGLGYEEDAADGYDAEPVFTPFTPFTQQAEPEMQEKKSRNPFLNLMRLVGDEAAKPSIRDLQKSVDVRDAFREPVYPQPLYRNEDDPT